MKYKDLAIDQLLHDLHWLVNHPHLFAENTSAFPFQFIQPKSMLELGEGVLKKGDLQPMLSDWFKSDEHVILGKYFERMVGFMLHTNPAIEVLLENHQLIKDERTTGEIDFLFRHRQTNRVVHLEVAVKYYLGYNHSQNHEDWIGPNGLDTLDRKMKKFQKQLGSSDELNDLIQRGVQKKQVLLMGYFFRHISSLKLPLGCHPFFQTRVQWMYERELDDYGWLLNEYYILPKYCWLSCTPNSSLLKYRNARDVRLAVKNELLRIGKGILIVGLDHANRKKLFMIVPNQWPNLSSKPEISGKTNV